MLFVSGGEPSIRRLLIPLVEDGGFGRPEVLLTGGDCGEPLGSGCERNTCGECVNSLYVFEGFAVRYCSCPHG